MNFFAIAKADLDKVLSLLGIMQATLPAVAAVNAANGQSNDTTAQMQSMIGKVAPLVQLGEQISTAAVAAGSQPLTGPQKLSNVKTAFDVAMGVATQAGVATPQAELAWAIIDAGITAAVQARNAAQPAASPAPAVPAS